ncbi:MAG: cytochrome b/b6 domain-containing protein [Campylobacter sp.]|uniref:cytochrome b/b6 domain-containing protein n=1 Tax=Campylobacter sp. TaxID=205 RepID=UPI002A834C90|nr:cytochrome b/b6 domain-containing protein [Campylobacter sp.]MCI7500722.1 cytochrome b/b6 domain-containing protein [Campylobacter sp.]MDY4154464.1 cytochrome b/b6 domain-containing protein [Campylobacter sp.]
MIISFFGAYFSEGFVHAIFGLLFVLVMLGISVFLVVLGYLASEEGVVYFAFILENYSSFAWIKDAHKMLANALLAIVCLHICGAFLYCVLNKDAAFKSMINGYKNSYKNVELHKFHRLLVPFVCL